MGYFSEQALVMTVGEMREERELDRMDGLTMPERAAVERYNHLAAQRISPAHCFVCNRVRPLINALVQGPDEQRVTGKAVAGRGHGVCRPCVKADEATALR